MLKPHRGVIEVGDRGGGRLFSLVSIKHGARVTRVKTGFRQNNSDKGWAGGAYNNVLYIKLFFKSLL